MPRPLKPRFIAYKSPDPMLSPRIKQDESLARLLVYLEDRNYRPSVFGPAIYYIPVKDGKLVNPKLAAVGAGIWMGGMKIRLFEFADPPPAPGVEFIRQTEFLEDDDG